MTSFPLTFILVNNLMRMLLLLTPWLIFFQDAPSDSLVLTRKVRIRITDPVNRATEIQRREELIVGTNHVRIEDLTFGTILIIRLDARDALILDRSLKTYSQVTFDQIAQARKGFLDALRLAKERVKGTADEQDIERVERGFQSYEVTGSSLDSTGRKEKDWEEKQLLLNGKIQILRAYLDPTMVREAQTYFRALNALSCFGEGVRPAMENLPGFPIRGVIRYSLFLDRIESEEEVQSVRREAVGDDRFAVPQGWKRVPLPGIEPDPAPPAKLPEHLRKGS
jgi:hypothetical protein